MKANKHITLFKSHLHPFLMHFRNNKHRFTQMFGYCVRGDWRISLNLDDGWLFWAILYIKSLGIVFLMLFCYVYLRRKHFVISFEFIVFEV